MLVPITSKGLILRCRKFAFSFGFSLLLASVGPVSPGSPVDEISQRTGELTLLEPGKPIDREMNGGETHSYRIELTKDQYLHAVVDQRGIDVALTLLGPNGQAITEIDSPNGTEGPEPIFIIVLQTATYRLDVKSLDRTATAGRYEARIEELRPATKEDRVRVDAQQALAAGDQLRAQETKDNIQKSIDKYAEAARQFHIIGDLSEEANSLNSIGEAYDDLGEKNKALQYYEQALLLSRSAKDRLKEATILKNLGEVYDATGDKQKALSLYDQALPIIQAAGDRHAEAIIFNDMAKVYFDLGQMKRSLDLYNRSLVLRRAVHDLSGEALELGGIGLIYGVLGEREKAIEFYKQALPITRLIGDRRGEAFALDNIGTNYRVLGEYEKALDSLTKALPLWRSVGSPVGEAAALSSIGSTYSGMNDKQRALDYYYQSLALSRSINDRGAQASTLSNIGNVYADLNEDSKAIDFFEQALALWRAVHAPHGEATTLCNIGASYEDIGQTQKALDYYNQALSLLRDSGYVHLESVVLNNLGAGHFFLKDYPKAIEFLNQALALKDKVGDRSGEIATYGNLGKTYEALGERQKALDLHNKALMISQNLHDDLGEAFALRNIGAWYDTAGDKDKALAAYESSIRATEKARAIATVEEIKSDLISQGISAYQRSVVLLVQLRRFVEAFNVAERARARAFLDQVGNVHPNIFKGNTELIKNEQILKAEIDGLERRLRQSRAESLSRQDADEIASLSVQLENKQREYEELITRLKITNPDYVGLRVVSTLTVPEVQGLLKENVTLLSFFVTPGETVAFVLTKNSLQAFEIPIQSGDLNAAVTSFRAFDNLNDSHPKSLKQLYNWLITPLKASLKTPVIGLIPHGILHYLPFAALTDGNRYFGEQYTIFTLPSASLLRFVRTESKANEKQILAVSQTEAEGLPRLQYADFEAQSVAEIYKSQALVGDDATLETLLKRASQYEILHIAAHGELNSTSPLFSRIILASKGDEKGFLEVRQVYSMNLEKTNLVVLSACETQLGSQSPGDDIVGLTRAFMYSGASTVISSVWTVDDESTGMLMTEFYKHLRTGMTKAAALREAQRLTRNKYPNPYYWAGFVLTGDPGK